MPGGRDAARHPLLLLLVVHGRLVVAAGLAAALHALVGDGRRAARQVAVVGRRGGLGSRDRLQSGALLVARGEFSIVIAGLSAKVVNSALAPTAAAFVLMSAIVGPIALRIARPPTAALGPAAEPGA